MRVSQLFDRCLRKLGVKSSTVPVLCHGCGRFIGIPKDQIQFVEQDNSPCCGAPIAPPPAHTKAGHMWDKFGGERMGLNDNPSPDADPEEMIESIIELDETNFRR